MRNNKMDRKKNIPFRGVFILFIFIPLLSSGQEFPEKPYPPRLVNDFTGLLQPGEANELEKKLVAYHDATSTQIAIVTIADLHGYAIADYAQRLAERWGIGQKGLDNGILILVKPKTILLRGQAFIAPGYGLEGVVPDIVCARIVDNEVLPEFRSGNYYKGLDNAVSILMSLASGEFPPGEYGESKGDDTGLAGLIFFIFILFIVILLIRGSGGANHKNIGSRGLPLWMILSMMNSGDTRHQGSWGGFSGGRSPGGGGFGGFGGGSFGGGGAGGSW